MELFDRLVADNASTKVIDLGYGPFEKFFAVMGEIGFAEEARRHGMDTENGDVFVVPSTPSNINVVGSVYDQNSFLYEPTRSVGAYLRLAGGPNRNADRHHEFVIRADGEVISRASVHGAWGDEFDRLRLYPGDTIMVPEKQVKVPFIQGAAQWSAMFSQLALGAAYLAILP